LTIAPILGTVVTTTETVFQLNNNGLTLTGGGYIPLVAGVTGLYQGTGAVIWIHAAGTLTATSANVATLILKLYQVPASFLPVPSADTSAQVITGSNLIATSATGTLAAGRTSGSFFLDAYVQLDAQGNLTGNFEGETFNTVTPFAALTQVTGLVGEADLNFFVTATQGVAETGNVVTLDEFSLNAV
jgi:hypothetical protein